MGFLGAILTFSVVPLTMAYDGCPPPKEIQPCTCDREGMNCMAAANLQDIRTAFQKTFKYGGIDAIWIQGTSIKTIPGDLFGNVQALKFFLEMNEIDTVDLRVFNNSKKHLRTMSFFGNKFTSFQFGRLEDYPELLIFNMGRNKLTSLPARAFSHENLMIVILSQNEISSIGQNAFAGLPRLLKLELFANRLTTLGPYSISLSPMASGCEVILTSNSISYISNTAFEGADPSVLYLTGNRLTSLKQEVFSSLVNTLSQSGGVIDVSGNPLNCKGCDYKWILNNRQAYNNIILGFVCPDGTGILSLNSFKIGC